VAGGFAGLVQSWAAIVMGMLSGSIPWVSMMVLHKKSSFLQKVRFCDIAFIFAFLHLCHSRACARYRIKGLGVRRELT
jgi:hypothetical protein